MLKEKRRDKTEKEQKKKDTVKITICPKNLHLLYRLQYNIWKKKNTDSRRTT